jgi:hypothetical protein
LVGVSAASFWNNAPEAKIPLDVAARVRFVAGVVGDLSGSYDAAGIRRWFGRPRAQLEGRAPHDLLQGAWTPADDGPQRVRAVARSLMG